MRHDRRGRVESRSARSTVDVWLAAPQVADVGPLLAHLDDVERARARALPSAQQHRFVLARALLRGVLGARLGCSAGEVDLRVRCRVCGGAHGQIDVVPRPGVEPCSTAAALHVSLTRAGPLIAIAVSDAGRVGVDIESGAAVAAARLADVALSPAERAALRRRPADERATAIARTWVRKEAVLKALGTGLRWDPAEIDTRRGTASLPRARPRGFPTDGARRDIAIADLPLGSGAVGAVALEPAGRGPGPWRTALGGRDRICVALHDGDAILSALGAPS